MKHVMCVHTAMALVEPLTKLFQELMPEVTVNHIADSSLIKEVIAHNEVTPAVRRRLLGYYNAAADAGADVVFNTCSSVGDVADYGNTYARIPVFRIDQPMAAEAVNNYQRIGVISTLPTTLDPTCRLLLNEAKKAGREVTLVEGLADGAFAAGQSGYVCAGTGFHGPHGAAALAAHGQTGAVESCTRRERAAQVPEPVR